MQRLIRTVSIALLVAVAVVGMTACTSSGSSGGSSASPALPNPLDIDLPTPDFDDLFG